jgi:hypothetical protein
MVKALKEVGDCSEVSMDFSTKKPRIQLRVTLNGNPGYEEAHAICSTIDRRVRHIVPNARVAIGSEASALKENEKTIWKIVKRIAETEPGSRGAQNIHLNQVNGKVGVDFLLLEADAQTARTEIEVANKLKTADSRISEVVIHRESVSRLTLDERSGHGTEARCYIEDVAKHFPSLRLINVVIRAIGDHLHVRIRVAPELTMSQERLNEAASQLGAAIKNGYHAITKVDTLSFWVFIEGPERP